MDLFHIHLFTLPHLLNILIDVKKTEKEIVIGIAKEIIETVIGIAIDQENFQNEILQMMMEEIEIEMNIIVLLHLPQLIHHILQQMEVLTQVVIEKENTEKMNVMIITKTQDLILEQIHMVEIDILKTEEDLNLYFISNSF